jgi:hypothetical protein
MGLMRSQDDPLAGVGLMQSPAEWAVRGRTLAGSLAELILDNTPAPGGRGLDIGCQRGGLIDLVSERTGLHWMGIDPILAEQIPNPYFPIESHSRLPFMGFLPIGLQRRYWQLSPVPWEHDFYVVTMRHVRYHAAASGFRVVHSKPFNYPLEAIPARVRPVARATAPLMRVFPWAWQFVLRKPSETGE